MRADRLLSILLTLQSEGKVKAGELARRLEVSPRTVYRDLDALTAAGVPVYAEPGPTGGITLMDGYRTQLTGLNRGELQTLFFGKPAALLRDLGLSGTADAALLKLHASLPAPARAGATSARGLLHIDTTGWRRQRDAVPLLPDLYDAVVGARRVQLLYARSDKTVTRLSDPLGLVAQGSVWYLVAVTDGETRTYRVSRLEGLEPTPETFTRPADFDLAAYWEASKKAFRAALPRYPVTVRAEPGIAQRLRTSGRYARVTAEDATPDDATLGKHGWVTLTMLFEVEWEACEYLLSFGPAVEVLDPLELRGQIAKLAQATAQLYAGGDCELLAG